MRPPGPPSWPYVDCIGTIATSSGIAIRQRLRSGSEIVIDIVHVHIIGRGVRAAMPQRDQRAAASTGKVKVVEVRLVRLLLRPRRHRQSRQVRLVRLLLRPQRHRQSRQRWLKIAKLWYGGLSLCGFSSTSCRRWKVALVVRLSRRSVPSSPSISSAG